MSRSVTRRERRDEHEQRHQGDGDREGEKEGERTPVQMMTSHDTWTSVVEYEDITPVATMRPETPLEYRAEQAAALHALLGLVLEGKASVNGEDHGRAVAILEEEVDLAARGFRKFTADEYMRDIREMMGAFDESPC